MSSKYTRDNFVSYLEAQLPTVKIVGDMSAEDELMKDFLEANNIGPDDQWIGLQFLPGERRPRALAASNANACMREEGGVFIHVVAPLFPDPRNAILDLADQVTNALELSRFGTDSDIIIRGFSTPNFEDGATLQFTDGFTSASLILDYYRDFSR